MQTERKLKIKCKKHYAGNWKKLTRYSGTFVRFIVRMHMVNFYQGYKIYFGTDFFMLAFICISSKITLSKIFETQFVHLT